MTKRTTKKSRVAQIAMLLTLLGGWSSGASSAWAQVAGFASSRQEAPARVESGSGVRDFVANLNPFKSRESEQPAQTATAPPSGPARISFANVPPTSPTSLPTAEQERAALISRPAVAPTAPAARAGATSTRSGSARTEARTYGTTRAAVASLGSSRRSTSGALATKKSSTGGVAALLLDELEEEIGDESFEPTADAKISASRRSTPVKRRSLRGESSLGSLELLEESLLEGADDAAENGLSADVEETPSLETGKTGKTVKTGKDGEADAELGPAIPAFATSENEESDASLVDAEVSEEYADSANGENGENSGLLATEESSESGENAADETLSLVASNDERRETKRERLEKSEKPEKPAKSSESKSATRFAVEESASLEELDDRFGSFFQERSEIQVEPARPTAGSDETSVAAGETWRVAESNDATVSSKSPIVEIETVGPKNLVVGQQSTFKIRARNVGSVAARKLVVTTELPETVVVASTDAKVGEARVKPRGVDGEARRCVWAVGTLDAGGSAELELTMTPQKRSAFELVSRFECERSSARTGVEVVEPILEARVEGRDAIEWGVEDKYRLRLRNVGNGDAEDVELFVSTGETSATQRIGVLKAGEEKAIEMAVKTVLDESISIEARATGAYGVEAKASKKIAVLRGKLDVAIEAPELQFVDGEFEAFVRVKNVGAAPLENVDVAAQIPASVEILACDGAARRNVDKGRVYWTLPLLRPNEEVVFKTICRSTEKGEATFAVVGADGTGLTAQNEATVQVESIAALAMRVNAPKDPVAVGKECVYELVIENGGTKDATEIESGVFLGVGLKPIAVEDGLGTVSESESKVIFRKIETLPAGERVVFRVRALAVDAGNHKVQAMLQSIPEDARLMSEEMTYCYERPAGRRQVGKASMVALEPSETDATTRR